jgi:hypothetical protein
LKSLLAAVEGKDAQQEDEEERRPRVLNSNLCKLVQVVNSLFVHSLMFSASQPASQPSRPSELLLHCENEKRK